MRACAMIGNIFQDLIHFDHAGENLILKNFVNRYNLEVIKGENLIPIPDMYQNNQISLLQTKKHLIRLANQQFRVIEEFSYDLNHSTFQLNREIITNLKNKAVGSAIIEIMRRLVDKSFESKQNFLECLRKLIPIREHQISEIWRCVLEDSNYRIHSLRVRLRNQNKWIALFSEAMLQMAKNYEYLDLGDESLKYAKYSHASLDKLKNDIGIEKKIILQNYIKEICKNKDLVFSETTTRELRQEIFKAHMEINRLNEIKKEFPIISRAS